MGTRDILAEKISAVKDSAVCVRIDASEGIFEWHLYLNNEQAANLHAEIELLLGIAKRTPENCRTWIEREQSLLRELEVAHRVRDAAEKRLAAMRVELGKEQRKAEAVRRIRDKKTEELGQRIDGLKKELEGTQGRVNELEGEING